jgi:serine/threonine-protein kinase HipA
MNPNELGNGLTLNITENSNDQDITLAMNTAKHYKLSDEKANKLLEEIITSILSWRSIAKSIGIGSSEIERVRKAFRVAENSN